MNELMVIGRSCFVSFPRDDIEAVPAKVDTGADSSSIWASDVYIDEAHRLHFVLFSQGSAWYTGKRHIVKDYEAIRIRSSNGQDEIRYRVRLSAKLANRYIRATFTLADRSKNAYPILIGRSALNKKFLVDVSRDDTRNVMLPRLRRRTKPMTLNEEMRLNPKAFYEKYHGNKES